MERFNELLKLYQNTKVAMSAICVGKGGVDIDNYAGRFFVADLLELLIVVGEKAKADKKVLEDLKKELETKRGLLTPQVKPIYEMSLDEFEKLVS